MNKDVKYFLTDIIKLSSDLNFAIIGLDTPSLQRSGIDLLGKHVCPMINKLLKDVDDFDKASLKKDPRYRESHKALVDDIQHLENCLNDQHFLNSVQSLKTYFVKIKKALVTLSDKID